MGIVENKAQNAFKWSSISELIAKIVTPLTNMVLARILAPDVFGIVATVTMVVSFAEVFVDSGFSKVLIQRSFESDRQEHQYMSVAFWANLMMSVGIWALIIVFNDPIAKLAGNEGSGYLLVVAGIMVPLHGIIGIQNALIRKRLEFGKLFLVRFFSAIVPLGVTVPLALLGLEHWSIIIGNIVGLLIRSLLLFIVGRFIPALCFDLSILKDIWNSAVWTTLDGVAVWGTGWIDVFIISRYMNDYQLGLYKNSIGTINALLGLVTAAVTPVMFSALSRVSDQKEKFNKFFCNVQRALCTIVLPMGAGLFLYRELATEILFGSKWNEAAEIVGIFSLTSVLRIVLVSIYSDVYRAKGKFTLPLILQVLDLVILIPVCLLSAQNGFWSLVYARSFVKLDLIIPEALCIWYVCGISPKITMQNISHSVLTTLIMSIAVLFLQSITRSIIWDVFSIIVACAIYFCVLLMFKEERNMLKNFLQRGKNPDQQS